MSLRVETFVVGPMPNNLYLLIDDEVAACVVVDPSIESDPAIARVRELQAGGIELAGIWNTHGHFDHVYDNARWQREFGASLWMHRDDMFWIERLHESALWMRLPAPEVVTPDSWIEPGTTMQIGRHAVTVLHTPGHSPGSVTFCLADFCISGDVLFKGSVGRTDLPGCSAEVLQQSLQQLCELPGDTRILPGHGAPTTIGQETQTNPYIATAVR
jgi:glyoxylase-like metal-dependent hydrolase (beta-lactamase superfamily II)